MSHMLLDTKMIFTGRPYQSLDQDEGLPLGTPSKSKSPYRFLKVYHIEAVLTAALTGALASAAFIVLALYIWNERAQDPSNMFTPDVPHLTPRVFDMHDEFINGVGTQGWKTTWNRELMPSKLRSAECQSRTHQLT